MLNNLNILSSAYATDITGLEKYFELKKMRRMDVFSRLALKAASQCLESADIDLEKEKNIALIIATGYGPVKRTCEFMDSIIEFGDECSSPLAFSSSVHNSALTSLSILLNIKGPSLTISNLETSFESACLVAQTWLNSGMADKVLLGAVDETHSIAENILKTNPQVFADFSDKEIGSGAAFFLLEKSSRQKEYNLGKSSVFNPSKSALTLAKEEQEILTPKEIERIACDFIKTELAKNKIDIFSVFEQNTIQDLLKNLNPDLQEEILSNLSLIFTSLKQPLPLGKEIDTLYNLFKQNALINFSTSGSTGEAKHCLHSTAMIKEEVKALIPLFKGIKRAISIVPSFHSYGFIFGLQVPKYLNVPIMTLPPIPTQNWEEILKEGDLLVAFPMFLKQFVSLNNVLPKGITILSSTAPCPDNVITSLFNLGLDNFIEIYGASEGGAIGYRRQANQGFTLLPHWRADIRDNSSVKITRKDIPFSIELPDMVDFKSDNTFRPIGRKDKVVQIAGVNVSVEKVKNVLKQKEYIKEVEVRLMREDEGNHLKAFIVLDDTNQNHDDILKDINAFIKEHLTVHEMPRKITFGKEIPRTAMGKLKDW